MFHATMSGSDEDKKDRDRDPAPREVTYRVENLGTGDGLLYTKADLVKACKVGSTYALSFYQLDYQDAVNTSTEAEAAGHEGQVTAKAIPAAKVILDDDAFRRFLTEIRSLAKRTGVDS